MKICKKCKKEKDEKEFRKCNRTKDHLFNWCMVCQDERNKYLYLKNKEKRIKQIKKWNQEHPDKLKQYATNHKKNNKDSVGENKM